MFELNQHPIKIMSIAVGAEHHGDDLHPAIDIKCVTYCENDALIELHPELRNMLFKENVSPDLEEQAKERDGTPTALRFPQMGAIKWDYKSSGYEFTVLWGLSTITIDQCSLSLLKLTPQNTGGIVKIEFGIHASQDLGKDVIGKMADIVKREVEACLRYAQEEDRQTKIAA